MEKIKDLHDASSFWFFVMAFFYVAMVLGLRNGYLVDFFLSWMRILDLPFALVALLYGGTALSLQLGYGKGEETKNSGWMLIIFTACLLLFSVLILINFGFPATI